MPRILVVDDDPEIVRLLRRGLIYEGYTIDTAADGNEALAAARDNPPELVILDVMMPGMNGIEVCRRLRQASSVPILLLTAKSAVTDKVAGLDSGADDYLVKPFDFNELVARVRALLRRRTEPGGDVLRFSSLTMDVAAHEMHCGEHKIELSSKEFDLLELFLRHPRQVLTRETLYDRIWGYDFGGESNILDVYIRYLRAKLEPFDAARLIQTVRGVGYVLKELFDLPTGLCYITRRKIWPGVSRVSLPPRCTPQPGYLKERKNMPYIIAEPCIDVKDRACIDVCPVDCIHPHEAEDKGEKQLFIDPDECIDCGACEPECPVDAIFPEDELPDKWQEYIAINANYFK